MDPHQPENPYHPPQPGPQPGFPPSPPPQFPNQAPRTLSWQQAPPQQPYNQPSYPQHPAHPGMPQPSPQFGSPYQQPPVPPKNKKKLILIVAAAVVAVGIGAFLLFGGGKTIVNKISGVELEKYTNTTFGFSMQVPKGWPAEEKNEEYYKDVSFDEPVGDVKDQSEANSNYANVHVTYNVADQEYLEQTEQKYFEGIKKGLQRAISEQETETSTDSGYEKEIGSIESEGLINVNGLNAYRVKLKITNYGGTKGEVGYTYGMFVFADNKTQYEVSVTAHESESVNAKAEAILDSFTRP